MLFFIQCENLRYIRKRGEDIISIIILPFRRSDSLVEFSKSLKVLTSQTSICDFFEKLNVDLFSLMARPSFLYISSITCICTGTALCRLCCLFGRGHNAPHGIEWLSSKEDSFCVLNLTITAISSAALLSHGERYFILGDVLLFRIILYSAITIVASSLK